MHHPTDRIAHTTAFVTPVVEHWLKREIAQWVCLNVYVSRHLYLRIYLLRVSHYRHPVPQVPQLSAGIRHRSGRNIRQRRPPRTGNREEAEEEKKEEEEEQNRAHHRARPERPTRPARGDDAPREQRVGDQPHLGSQRPRVRRAAERGGGVRVVLARQLGHRDDRPGPGAADDRGGKTAETRLLVVHRERVPSGERRQEEKVRKQPNVPRVLEAKSQVGNHHRDGNGAVLPGSHAARDGIVARETQTQSEDGFDDSTD